MARKLARERTNQQRVSSQTDDSSPDSFEWIGVNDELASVQQPNTPVSTNEDDQDTEQPGSVGRRAYLRAGTAAVAGAAIAGATGLPTAAADATREGIEFDTVVDAVDDLGLDPNGNSPIQGALSGIDDGTLVQFPPGEYLLSDTVVISGMTVGFESTGDERATIVAQAGQNMYAFNGHHCPGIYLSGIDFDMSADSTVVGLRLLGNQIHIEDVEFHGRTDIYDERAINMLNCSIEDGNGYGEIRNLVATEGHWARYGPGSGGRIGIYTGPRHEGVLRVVDCDFREFGNNAMYCSRNYGDVRVEDSHFENNNAASVRIGGDGSYVDNCTFVTDPNSYTGPRTYEDTAFHHRNIVIEENFDNGLTHQKPAGAEVRNSTIRVENNPANGAAIHRYGNGRSLRIENTSIEYNNDGYRGAVLADTGGFGASGHPSGDPPKQIEFINSVLFGTGDVDAAMAIVDASGTTIENSTIAMTDGSQDGLTIADSDDCLVVDSNIYVPGRATVFNNSDVVTENLTHEEPDDLSLPEEDGDDEDGSDADDGDNPDGSDDSDEQPLEHQLRIIADEDADLFAYTFTVDGEVEFATDVDYPANPEGAEELIENDDGTVTVEGQVMGNDGDSTSWGGNTFWFEGSVIAFSKEGPATVYLDGEEIDPNDLVSGDEDADDEEEETGDDQENEADDGEEVDGDWSQLRIIADEDQEVFAYTFTVDGEVEFVTDGDYPANPEGAEELIENDDGTVTVEGRVAGNDGDSTSWGGDTFRIAGELLTFEKEGEATILLDGEVIDIDEFLVNEERQLRVNAKLFADEVTYQFVTDGSVERLGAGTVLEVADGGDLAAESISETDEGNYRVEGSLKGGQYTTYRIDSAIKSMQLSGAGRVTIDDDPVDPASYGLPEQLTVVGIDETASYEFTVDGDLAADPNGSRDTDRDISGSAAEGAVTSGVSSYRFDGEIVDFQLSGRAAIYRNGVQIDPADVGGDSLEGLDHWVVIEGSGSETEYHFSATGAVHKAPDLGTVDADDEVEDGSVSGTIADGTDGYRFDGDLEVMWVIGDAEVRFNDE